MTIRITGTPDQIKAVHDLAEDIADYRVDMLNVKSAELNPTAKFDRAVTVVYRAYRRDISTEHLAAAISYARDLVGELGVMTFTDDQGRPCLVRPGGSPESLRHDARTAHALRR